MVDLLSPAPMGTWTGSTYQEPPSGGVLGPGQQQAPLTPPPALTKPEALPLAADPNEPRQPPDNKYRWLKPPKHRKQVGETCWAYALFAWFEVLGVELKPRFRNSPDDLINFFMWEDKRGPNGEFVRKKMPDTEINYLNDDRSLPPTNVDAVLKHFKVLKVQTYIKGKEIYQKGGEDFINDLLMKYGHILVMDIAGAGWKHVWIAYGAGSRNQKLDGGAVWWMISDTNANYNDHAIISEDEQNYRLINKVDGPVVFPN